MQIQAEANMSIIGVTGITAEVLQGLQRGTLTKSSKLVDVAGAVTPFR